TVVLPLPVSPTPATTLLRDRTRSGTTSNLSDIFIFLWCVSADTAGADHFAFKLDSNTALQGSGPGQRQRRDPPVAHLILKDFARPPENSRGPRFSDADFHACDLRVVEALEEQHMSAIIHHYDHDSRTASLRFGFGGSG